MYKICTTFFFHASCFLFFFLMETCTIAFTKIMSYISKTMQFCIKIVWCGKFCADSEFYVLHYYYVYFCALKYAESELRVEFESWEPMSRMSPILSLGMGLTDLWQWQVDQSILFSWCRHTRSSLFISCCDSSGCTKRQLQGTLCQ